MFQLSLKTHIFPYIYKSIKPTIHSSLITMYILYTKLYKYSTYNIYTMPSYQANKKSIYNWRQKNLEKNREINKRYKRKYDAWKKEKFIFLQILL